MSDCAHSLCAVNHLVKMESDDDYGLQSEDEPVSYLLFLTDDTFSVTYLF